MACPEGALRVRIADMVEIKRFIEGILMANGYVLSTPDGHCYIVDPGYRPKKYIKEVSNRGLRPEGIILTHHHGDHSGAADIVSRELDCPVMIHRKDADVYDGRVDVLLEGGEELPLGDEIIRIIHTPGHTRGGICLMLDKSRVCFTGDTIFNVDLGRTDLEDGSYEEMCETITDIVDGWENDIRIYPGHGDDCTMKKVRQINNEFLEIVGS